MDQYNNYIGLTLDERYTIKRLVGMGGMAMVFEADDNLKKTVVAVKILKEEFASDEVSVQRFINESKAVLMLSHTNIVKVFDVSVKGEHKYIVMEYIDGITLKNYMERKGALSVKETISYTTQILRALEHAHIGGIIHRDIKPQNIMLLKNGQIKVTDFGIAKLPDAKTLTATDKAIGTVYYISPEQAAGEKWIDRRTDLYSVGVLMYEMLTGKLPFDGENPVSIALKQINEEPKAPSELQSNIPKGLEQIVLFAMEKDRNKRFQTATQMIELLMKVRENPMVIFRQKSNSQGVKKKKNKAPLMPIIMGVVVAFLSVLIFSGVWVIKEIFFSEEAQVEKVVQVENYVGKAYDEVKSDIKDVFFNVKREYVDSTKEQRGIILRQSPEAGQSRKTTEITLYIGKGIDEVTVPNCNNISRKEAETRLWNSGLKYDYMYETSDIIKEERVIETLPKAGETVMVGTTVTLVVSSGENSDTADTVKMPLLMGLTVEEAYAELVEYELHFGGVDYIYSEDVEKGKLISQSPAYETTVTKGVQWVSFTVSLGPAPRAVPSVTGYTPSLAKEILAAEGFNVGSETSEYNDYIDPGVIIRQSPSAGAVAEIGTAVSLVVSGGPTPYIPPENPVGE